MVIGRETLEDFIVSRHVHESHAHVIGSVVIRTDLQLRHVLNKADGCVDIVLLDVADIPGGPERPIDIARAAVTRSRLLTYLDLRVWVDAVEEQVVRLFDENVRDTRILVAGDHQSSRVLAAALAARGARVALLAGRNEQPAAAPPAALERASMARDGSTITTIASATPEATEWLSGSGLVVVWPKAEAWFGADAAALLAPGTFLLDARIGGILPEGLAEARRRGLRALRVNIWPTLVGTLGTAHDSAVMYREAMGWTTLRGVPVVAGGAIGEQGDVVVDNVKNPTRVVGIADGLGGVRFSYDREDTERVRKVSEEINTRKVSPHLDLAG